MKYCDLLQAVAVYCKADGGMDGGKMPRKPNSLSALEVRRLTKPGMHTVGEVPGLYLNVSTTGAQSWILRIMIGKKRREIGLGGYPEVGLADARTTAREMRKAVSEGRDPLEERREARAALKQRVVLTFRQAAETFFEEKKRPELRSGKHAQNWLSSVRMHAYPIIGERSIEAIKGTEILDVLTPIWTTKTPTAKRLRQRIEEIFEWAKVRGACDGENPARWAGHLREQLPKPGKITTVKKHPAVALDDLSRWFARTEEAEGMGAWALRFLALTAARSGEVRFATWKEINLTKGLWTIPASRMKGEREHRVPLSDAACQLLVKVPRMKDSELLFTAPRGGELSDATISKCMKRVNGLDIAAGCSGFLDPRSGFPAVPHGLRSSFRDWVAERTEYPGDMAEIALSHQVGKEVERAYLRSDFLEKRRQMMKDWAGFLSLSVVR